MEKYDKKNIRSWSLLGIAPSVFIYGVSEVMKKDEDTILITADTGRYCGFQKISEELQSRIYNFGIAEQNMMGIAAGMALEGKKVFVTTYAPFVTFRCADQMRHLMGNLNLNIKAIGTASGFSAAASGPALNAINDIAFTRSIPNLVVLSPADCLEAVKMIQAMSEIASPVYMRFSGLVNLPIVYKEDFDYVIGKANELINGEKVAILATGTNIVYEASKAAELIEKEIGIKPTVADIHTIKPLDIDYINKLMENHDLIVTVEEHSVIGGLGSAVSEQITKKKNNIQQIIIGVEDKIYPSGDRMFMLKQCGLNAEAIAASIIKNI